MQQAATLPCVQICNALSGLSPAANSHVFSNASVTLVSTQVATELIGLRKECDRFKELSSIFEFPQLVEPIVTSINEAYEDLVMVKDVWDTAQLCELQFADWRQTLWEEIRTDLMEDGAKNFVKEVKSLNKKVGALPFSPRCGRGLHWSSG